MAKSKKEEKHTGAEYLENPELLREQLSRSEQFLESNKTVVFTVIGIIAVAIAGFFGYKYYKDTQNTEAQNAMYQAIYYFESDSLDLALNGDGVNLGLTAIVDEYPGTPAANLANYYAGVSFLKKGQFRPAQLYLEDFTSDDLLVQSRAYSLLGDVHMEQDDYAAALDYYQRAADNNPTNEFTPVYLMQAAHAAELLGDTTTATDYYNRVINDFPKSDKVNDAKKFMARLQGVG